MNKPIILSGPRGSGKSHIANIIASWYPEPYTKRYNRAVYAKHADVAEMKVYRLVIVDDVDREAQLTDIIDLFTDTPELQAVRLVITTQLHVSMIDEIDRTKVDIIFLK